MIKVTIGTNFKRDREPRIVSENATPREILEEAGVDYTKGMTNLDGSPLMPGDMDKSFKNLGITNKCFLTNVVKADNA